MYLNHRDTETQRRKCRENHKRVKKEFGERRFGEAWAKVVGEAMASAEAPLTKLFLALFWFSLLLFSVSLWFNLPTHRRKAIARPPRHTPVSNTPARKPICRQLNRGVGKGSGSGSLTVGAITGSGSGS